jgi:signal transduction histidine kinase
MPVPTAQPAGAAVRAEHGRVLGLWQRFAAVPFALEATVVVVSFVSGLTTPPSDEPGIVAVRGSVAVLWLLGSCLALLGIRRRPELAWAVAFSCGVVHTVDIGAGSAVVVQAAVALFPIAVLRPTRTMAATTSITVATYGLLAVLVTGSWIAALSLVAWIVVAAAVGVAVRNQRRALESAQLRALQAEATRDEEAQRRVAEERLRIAQELHDVIAHHVSVINVQSGVARHLLHRDPASAQTALDAVREASRSAR